MRISLLFFIVIAPLVVGTSYSAEQCGPLVTGAPGQYGPFDYRTDKDKLATVENFHFNKQVEQLVSGMTSTLGADIGFTLRAFPNHHRALMSMARLGEKLKTEKPPNAIYSISCYFERALAFRPDDNMVRVIFATHLAKIGKSAEAVEQMHAAEKTTDGNANVHYNLGLVYLTVKDYDKALEHAHRAYELGFPLPGLRNLLTKQGKWREPPPKVPAEVTTPGSTDLAPSPPAGESAPQQNK